jgi:Holliday junction resolvase RusA-like endonuclease
MVRGKFAHAYYPAAYKKWKELFAEIVKGPSDPLEGPLVVTINCLVPKPRTSKLQFPKPDVDNYAKSVMDALTQIELWLDDCQVVDLHVTKRFTTGEPLILVSVEPYEEIE